MNILICVHSEGGYAPLRFMSGDISFLLAMSQYSYQFSRTPESAHGILNTVYNAPNVYRPLCNFPRFLRYIAQSPRNKGNGLDWALAFWPCFTLPASIFPFAYPKKHNGGICNCLFLCISALSIFLGIFLPLQWLIYILDFLLLLLPLV